MSDLVHDVAAEGASVDAEPHSSAPSPAELPFNRLLAARVIARERETISLLMRRLKALDPATETHVWGHLIAQVIGCFAGALSDASPGSIFTPEVMLEWLVGLLHDYERQKYGGDDGAGGDPRPSSTPMKCAT